MKTSLIVTDLTRMQQGRVCVAGYRPENGTCIRPVMPKPGLMETWMYVNNQVIIRPFALIELDLVFKEVEQPHTEDWLIISTHPQQIRLLTQDERREWLQKITDPHIENIFGEPIRHEGNRWFIPSGRGNRSLGTIGPIQIQKVDIHEDPLTKSWHPYMIFGSETDQSYRLNVTDLAFRYYVDYLRKHKSMSLAQVKNHLTMILGKPSTVVFLRIGLARGTWDKYPNCCHLQITGVYSFPDYLEGRCFADYRPND